MEKIRTVNAQVLTEWMKTGKAITILDVRPQEEREEWSIPRSLHADVYSRLKTGDREALNHLSLDQGTPVVTLCARGKMSVTAAEILAEKGYEVYSLEGGMSAWNYAWDTATMAFKEGKIIQVRRLAKGCLSYIIGSDDEAMVVDASLDPTVYQTLAKQHGWAITKVADTHIHADYVSRTRELARATGAQHLMAASAQTAYGFTPVDDGERLRIGKTELEVMHTPGHTWESTSFLIKNTALFSGDTLFTDGIGRPDLKAGGNESVRKAHALYDSLKRLMSLDQDTWVLPAHISESVDVGSPMIKATLDQLRTTITAISFDREKFTESLLSRLPASPANYLTIAAINKKGNIGDFNIADLEAGANRCAVK